MVEEMRKKNVHSWGYFILQIHTMDPPLHSKFVAHALLSGGKIVGISIIAPTVIDS